ncbi:MAG: STAS domain-containing protein [Desulfobacula sp.]|jgi:anti-anti-sigma regulatory factor
MECNINPKGNDCCIKFSGAMGIAQANEAKTILVKSLSSYRNVVLDLKEVSDVDMSIVQLLCSANMSFEKSDRHLTITGKDKDLITALLTELGYENDFGCSGNPCNTCLWKGEEQ